MKKRSLLVLCVLFSVFQLFSAPKVAYVLSGGGARGIAHIPILKELERRGIYPDLIVGTSMGGLVGGLYASGYSADELEEFVLTEDITGAFYNFKQASIRKTDSAYFPFDKNLFSLQYGKDGLGSTNSLLDDEGVDAMLSSAIAKTANISDFEELSIPFAAIGTDFKTGEKIVFDSGSLFDAMRATMSLPIVLPPYILEDGRFVVDGGMVENLPVETAREMGADIIIAVDVNEDVRVKGETTDTLATLSGVITQYMILSTQTAVIKQYDYIDYLCVPYTGNFGVADFSNTENILAATEQYVKDNQEFFDQLEAAVKRPDMKAPLSYDERSYFTISKVVFPENLSKYASLLMDFNMERYDDVYISRLSEVLETIREREHLKSVSYRIKGSEVHIFTEEYYDMPSYLSIGLTGGGYLSYNPYLEESFTFPINPDLSISTNMDFGSISYFLALKIGQQNILFNSLDVPILQNFALDIELWGGFGGYSIISDRLVHGRYATKDFSLGGTIGLSYFPKRKHRFDVKAGAEAYFLGGEENFFPDREKIWDRSQFIIPEAVISYHYNSLNDKHNAAHAEDIQSEVRLGYYEGFIYSLAFDMDLAFQIASVNDYMDIRTTVFSSRYPYQLISSYRTNPFGAVSRDYLSLEVDYRRSIGNFFVAGGLFAIGDSGYGNLVNDSPDSLNNALKGVSLVPFSTLSDFHWGLGFSAGHVSDFGIARISMGISFSGEFYLGLTIK